MAEYIATVKFTNCGEDGCGECDVCKYCEDEDFLHNVLPGGSTWTKTPKELAIERFFAGDDRNTQENASG